LAYEVDDCDSGAAFDVAALVVENPGEDVDDCGEDAASCEVDTDVTRRCRASGGEDNVACRAEEGEEDYYEACIEILISVICPTRSVVNLKVEKKGFVQMRLGALEEKLIE
jgi:hypothetical protein